MALPSGITPKSVTVGIASFFDGSLAEGTATITAPVNVVHTPTNRPIFSSQMSHRFVDGETSFNLAPTDAPGLNRVDWTYKLNVIVSGALVQPEPVYFTLPTAGPDVIDLDGLVTVPSSAGTPISVDVLTTADLPGHIADYFDENPISSVPGGGAGGALSGSYPNPGLNETAVENVVVNSDAVKGAFGRVENVVRYGADPTGAADSRAAIVAAIEAAAASGLPVYVPEGTYKKDGAAIPIPSNVEVFGAGWASVIKNGTTPTAPIFTNSDTAAGNTGISLHHLKLDANGPAASSGQFSVVDMDNLTRCTFDQLEVAGGRNDGVAAGSGSGLRITRMTRSRIGYIYAHDLDYDGVLLGGCTDNAIDTVHGVDCKRNALQLSRYPIGSGTTPSMRNIVGKVIAEHSTGVPGGTSPTTGGVYFHNSQYNHVGLVVAEGVRMAVGGIGTDTGSTVGNIIGQVLARTRYVDRAAIDWEGECYRNKIGHALIRPLSGASGIYLRAVGNNNFNTFKDVHAFVGGGTGTWTLSLSANCNDNDIEIVDAAGAPTIVDGGARNIVRYTNAGEVFIKKTGVAAVKVA